jgi:hypothetical protein
MRIVENPCLFQTVIHCLALAGESSIHKSPLPSYSSGTTAYSYYDRCQHGPIRLRLIAPCGKRCARVYDIALLFAFCGCCTIIEDKRDGYKNTLTLLQAFVPCISMHSWPSTKHRCLWTRFVFELSNFSCSGCCCLRSTITTILFMLSCTVQIHWY